MDSQSETLIRWDRLFERMNKSKPTDTSPDKRIKTFMAPCLLTGYNVELLCSL